MFSNISAQIICNITCIISKYVVSLHTKTYNNNNKVTIFTQINKGIMKKYFTSKKEANKAREERQKTNPYVHVFKMPKGSRNAGQWAVCTEMEYLNTY